MLLLPSPSLSILLLSTVAIPFNRIFLSFVCRQDTVLIHTCISFVKCPSIQTATAYHLWWLDFLSSCCGWAGRTKNGFHMESMCFRWKLVCHLKMFLFFLLEYTVEEKNYRWTKRKISQTFLNIRAELWRKWAWGRKEEEKWRIRHWNRETIQMEWVTFSR